MANTTTFSLITATSMKFFRVLVGISLFSKEFLAYPGSLTPYRSCTKYHCYLLYCLIPVLNWRGQVTARLIRFQYPFPLSIFTTKKSLS